MLTDKRLNEWSGKVGTDITGNSPAVVAPLVIVPVREKGIGDTEKAKFGIYAIQ